MKNSEIIATIAPALTDQLEAESPLYKAVLDGTASKEAYIEFLVMHYKYIRLTNHIVPGYAEAMARSENKTYRTIIASGARNHAREEHDHDPHIVEDLADLWGCTTDEALRRVDAIETAPAVRIYEAMTLLALERFPCGMTGLICVLETVATRFCKRAMENFRANRPWPEVDTALRFLHDHSEDEEHVAGGSLRMDLLEPGHDSSAVITMGRTVAVLYREMYRYLDGRLAGRVTAARTEAAVLA